MNLFSCLTHPELKKGTKERMSGKISFQEYKSKTKELQEKIKKSQQKK